MEKIVVFTIIGTPIFYVGAQIASDRPEILTIARPLMGISEKGKVDMVKVPHASRESTISLNTNVIAGLLITEPTYELVNLYQSEITPAYSSLTFAK